MALLGIILVYIVIGSFDIKKVSDAEIPLPSITRVAVEQNSVVAIEKIKNFTLSQDEQKIIENYFSVKDKESLRQTKPILEKYSDEINDFESAIQKPYWFNNNIPENNIIIPDIKFPPLALTKSLSRLYILRTETALQEKLMSQNDYQNELQKLYNFGQAVQTGSYSIIEFVIGKSIKNMTLGELLQNSNKKIEEKEINIETRKQILLSEYAMSFDFIKTPKNDLPRSFLLHIPFLYQPNRTTQYLIDEIKNTTTTLDTQSCAQYKPLKKFHWFTWLTPNSLGKKLASELVTVSEYLCSE